MIQEVNQTIKNNAAPAVAYYNRANIFYGTRDYDQAIKYYNQAIKLQPDNADALNQRCGARAIVGELKAALEDCNAALSLKPNNATALDHRGMAYLKLGQPDQALVDYDEALKLNPNSPAALYGRGVAKLMKGDVAASNADFEVAKEHQAEHRRGVLQGRRARRAAQRPTDAGRSGTPRWRRMPALRRAVARRHARLRCQPSANVTATSRLRA